MLSFERETGFIVIKLIHAFYHRKRVFRMTFAAILSEPVFMHIGMATGAVIKFDTRKVLKFHPIHCIHLMAFDTFHLNMFSLQGKFGFVVVELSGRFKFFKPMTVGTVF